MARFMSIYDNLIAIGRVEHPIPETTGRKGRPVLGKARSFVERMAKHKGEVCLFFTNFIVPFDNNQAEHDQRHLKVKEKVSGCFRTKEGASNFASINSLLGTAKKMGYSALEELRLMLAGRPEDVLIPIGARGLNSYDNMIIVSEEKPNFTYKDFLHDLCACMCGGKEILLCS